MHSLSSISSVSREHGLAANMATQKSPEVRARLRYKKPHKYLKSYQLPFVGSKDEFSWDFWRVPLIGGYDARDAGGYFAQMLMVYFRQNETEFADGNLLSSIVLDMMRKGRTASDKEWESLECQVYGFMAQLSVCLIGGANSHFMRGLDNVDLGILLQEANAALNRKPYYPDQE
ncbi:hypothetical protein FEA48_11035 [Pseudomonas nitroreducens]|uniref:Uncharacterized protein n=1 Tax=Pseudomonas nitroreducens TaxID=46680 RepID=A0A5R9A7X0_PSENT|nr:hypothetical protein [Pseudomonas nitroreducens]TLP74741.1 hypothetical protein FEA48_11035 [Pseudomonas nitroreducens]